MNFIDTHSHLYLEEFDGDRSDVIDRAKAVGVSAIVMPAIDWVTMDRLEQMCQCYSGFCYPMIGLHPEEVKDDFKEILCAMKGRLDSNPSLYIGIGEIGLDFYWDETYREQQISAFVEQVQWAIDKDLPIVVHSRNAHRELVDTLYKYKDSGLRGVFHCFCGTQEEAEELLQFDGFFLGIGGVLTFKKSTLPAVVRNIPLSRILVETDSPYLAPVPHRGKRNESSFVFDTLKAVAAYKEMDVEQVAEITTLNAKNLFKGLKSE